MFLLDASFERNYKYMKKIRNAVVTAVLVVIHSFVY